MLATNANELHLLVASCLYLSGHFSETNCVWGNRLGMRMFLPVMVFPSPPTRPSDKGLNLLEFIIQTCKLLRVKKVTMSRGISFSNPQMTHFWAWRNKDQHTLSNIHVKTSLRLITIILFTTVRTIDFICLLAWTSVSQALLRCLLQTNITNQRSTKEIRSKERFGKHGTNLKKRLRMT